MGNSTMYGPDLASNIGDYFSAQQANIATEQRIDRQNAFTANQNETKYQRGVADLRAAGLNPILAAGGAQAGSSSGGFASAQEAAQAPAASIPTAEMVDPATSSMRKSQAVSASALAEKDKAVGEFYKNNPQVGGYMEASKGVNPITSAVAAASSFGKKVLGAVGIDVDGPFGPTLKK